LGEPQGQDDIERVRHLICALLGHRFGASRTIMGFTLRRCTRCGTTESSAEG
jgi:hypothetical protein